jgi:hypothetical protein
VSGQKGGEETDRKEKTCEQEKQNILKVTFYPMGRGGRGGEE